MKTLGILTSGGDAPGMNAALRSAVRAALLKGWRIFGFLRGYEGVIGREYTELGSRSVSNILQRGGTILRTARSEAFMTLEGQQRAALNLKDLGVDALIIIGGDGTFRGAAEFSKIWKGQIIGVPGTIDNDLYGTNRTIGFDTAVNTALSAIDKIRDTADSHERFFIVEVMGRNSGFLALEVGLTGGAEEIIVPDEPFDIQQVWSRLSDGRKRGKTSSVIIVAEGVRLPPASSAGCRVGGGAYGIAEMLKKIGGQEYRVCVLGHIQRGGSPTAADRMLASKLGAFAVDAIQQGQSCVMVGEVRGKLVLTPLEETWQRQKGIEPYIRELARALAT